MDKKDLKEAIEFAYSEMPEDSMDIKEAEKQKKIMLKKINDGKITTIDEVLKQFDRMM